MFLLSGHCPTPPWSASPVSQVLTNAGQANAATGTQGYEDAVTCANALAGALGVQPDDVLLQSTGGRGGGGGGVSVATCVGMGVYGSLRCQGAVGEPGNVLLRSTDTCWRVGVGAHWSVYTRMYGGRRL